MGLCDIAWPCLQPSRPSLSLNPHRFLPAVCPLLLRLARSDPVAAFPAIKSAILNTFSQYEVMSEREIQLDR